MTPNAAAQAAEDRLRRRGIGELVARSAARYPDKTALVFGNMRYRYRELEWAVNRAAHALRERGIRRGERVALFPHDNDAYVILFLPWRASARAPCRAISC